MDRLAALAHLRLSEADRDRLTRQLGDVLGYVAQLAAIDTTGVPETATLLADHAPDRPDVVQSSLDREVAIAAAPDGQQDRGMFRVPRVIG